MHEATIPQRDMARQDLWRGGRSGDVQERVRWQKDNAPIPNSEHLARALGWFSIGLGLAQIVTPRKVAGLIGVSQRGDTLTVMRTVGLRELVSGVGILSQEKPTGWLQARLGGDVIDLALLAKASEARDADPDRIKLAAVAVVGVTIADLICSQQLSNNNGNGSDASTSTPRREVKAESDNVVRRAVTLDRSPEALYQFWRNFENLPRFMTHLESVTVTDDKRSHWVAKGPAGSSVEWDAEVIADEPNRMIAWRSLEGADVDNAGSVRFEPSTGGRGTVIKVEMGYNPPGGVLGATVAKLLGQDPAKQVTMDLMRFKQMIETGEIARTEGQPAGRPSSTSKLFDDFLRS